VCTHPQLQYPLYGVSIVAEKCIIIAMMVDVSQESFVRATKILARHPLWASSDEAPNKTLHGYDNNR